MHKISTGDADTKGSAAAQTQCVAAQDAERESRDKWDAGEQEQRVRRGVCVCVCGGVSPHIPQCIPTSRQEVFNY